jgi:hypothetical protein
MPDQARDGQTTRDEIAIRVAEAGARAKAEADVRREKAAENPLPPEQGGPKGLEPTRYGDWERKGIAVDF